MFEFKIKNTHKKARSGFLSTPHGEIETPNLAIVATHGRIKLLNKTEHFRANPDLLIANAFHLFVNNKVREIEKAGGLHQWSGFKKPIMTDSGGFQIFSLGWGRVYGIGKVMGSSRTSIGTGGSLVPATSDRLRSRLDFSASRRPSKSRLRELPYEARLEPNQVCISEDSVIFSFNGKKFELTPEKSIKIQQDLAADIIFAFDECTSPLHSYAYTKKAMERTNRWAVRCLNFFHSHSQSLFGIVQGGIFEDLRKKSSKFIGSLAFDGFGIGGSFGEKQMKEVLGWTLSGLPEEKPRHLLGIGKIKDIFIAVKQGIDLFDCVVPTREARHGVLYTKAGKLAIEKGIFSHDRKLIEKNCGCWVCRQGITKQELHYLFKTQINADNPEAEQARYGAGKQIDAENIRVYPRSYPRLSASTKAKRLATIHNIYFFKNFFREIREAIVDKRLEELGKEYYNYK